MSLKRFQQPVKVIELGIFEKGGTSIMRKATDVRLEFSDAFSDNMAYMGMGVIPANPTERPLGSAVIRLNVQQFFVGENDAEGNPTYGQQMRGEGMVPNFPVEIRAVGQDYLKVKYADAAKTTIDLSHPDCGQFLCHVNEANAQSSEEGGVLNGVEYMYDNEFFRQVAYQNYIMVMPLLEAFIRSYGQRGGFDIK